MKSSLKSARGILVSRLVCAALTLQPVLVSAPAFARPESSAPEVMEESINGKPFSVSKLVVHARPEAVWQVLTDYNNAPRVFPQLKKCEVVEDKGTTKILKHKVSPSGMGSYEYCVEVKESSPKSLEWHRTSGAFKEVDGFWKLEPMNGGRETLVTYSAHVNGGLFIPQALVKRQFRMDMPAVMTSLKSQSETIHIAGRPVTGTN